MAYNPSLFILLPRGVCIYRTDVANIIDAQDYGEINQVNIHTTKYGDRNAVVHFDRWFRSSDEIIKKLSRGFVNIRTSDFGTWRASVYIVRSPNVTVRKPNKHLAAHQKKQRSRSPVMTDESEIPAVILDFIETCRISEQQYVDVIVEDRVYNVPIAPCLSDPAPQVLSLRHPDDMEIDEGEILAL